MKYTDLSKFDYPKNFDEFMQNKDLLFIVRKWITSYNFKDTAVSNTDDLFQDICLQLLQKSYIEKYDPTKANFLGYLSKFVKNYLNPIYKKETKSVNGPAIVNRASILNEAPEFDENVKEKGVVYAGLIEDKSATQDFGYNLLLEEALAEAEKFKGTSTVEYNGKVFKRDPRTVLELLAASYSVKEIAEIFNTSKQFIYNNLKKLRTLDVFVEARLEK